MSKAERLEFSELPERVGLTEAIELNQKLWRERDRFVSASSPVEVPQKFVQRTFDKVTAKFEEYILPYYLTHKPIVGASVLPEIVFSWGKGYYLPDLGTNRPMKLFLEFGTEWLANEALGKDPFLNNHYLGLLVDRLKNHDKKTKEDLFLYGLFVLLEGGGVPRAQMTDVFARAFIGGDSEMLERLAVQFSNNSTVGYIDVMDELKSETDYSEMSTITKITNPLQMAITRPLLFAATSIQQFKDSGRSVKGVTSIPGVINLAGFQQLEAVLTHEYIHSLGYRQNFWGGIPINGYKIGMGMVMERNG